MKRNCHCFDILVSNMAGILVSTECRWFSNDGNSDWCCARLDFAMLSPSLPPSLLLTRLWLVIRLIDWLIYVKYNTAYTSASLPGGAGFARDLIWSDLNSTWLDMRAEICHLGAVWMDGWGASARWRREVRSWTSRFCDKLGKGVWTTIAGDQGRVSELVQWLEHMPPCNLRAMWVSWSRPVAASVVASLWNIEAERSIGALSGSGAFLAHDGSWNDEMSVTARELWSVKGGRRFSADYAATGSLEMVREVIQNFTGCEIWLLDDET